jgi:hypothetical protein
VVPRGRGTYIGQHGGFTLLEFTDYSPALYRADHATGVLFDNAWDVAVYRSVVRTLDALALDEERSRALISDIAAGLSG